MDKEACPMVKNKDKYSLILSSTILVRRPKRQCLGLMKRKGMSEID